MRKHTKGPWKIDGKTELCITDVDDISRFIGSASIMGAGNNYAEAYEEAKANARLMAAAPDLLDALEAMIDSGEIAYCYSSPLVILAKKAIDKALGE
jgi:hypothetical protein